MSNGNKNWFEKSDKMVLVSALTILLSFIGWALINPDGMFAIIGKVFNTLTGAFGWAYLMAGAIFLVFALWLAFGPFGNVKLGKDDEKPQYSFFTWFSMIIACGYGVGLVYWCVAEPLSFLQSPPFGAEPMSAAAAERALAQKVSHLTLVLS
jgi:choline-glycine betaine transporter